MNRIFKNKSVQMYLIFMSFALLLTASIISIEFYFFSGSAERVALENGADKIKEREGVFRHFMKRAESNLVSIAECEFFEEYLDSGKHTRQLENLFLTYAKANEDFMQLRYIDRAGMERIRVDRPDFNQTPMIISHADLQDKSERYYFKESLSRPLNKTWFSELDLNIEHGQVEKPYRPTIRAVLPLERGGEFTGILIINFFMQPFLERLTNAPLYDLVLFNGQGDILYHFDPEKAWSAYSSEKKGLVELYPEVANGILVDNNVVQTSNVVAKKFDLPVLNDIYAMLSLNQSYVNQEWNRSVIEYRSVLVTVFILSIALSLLVVRLFKQSLMGYKEIKRLNSALQKQSMKDELTQLCNRKAYNHRVAELLAEYKRYGKPFSMVMIDVDDFKNINDTYGHAIGDQVLKELAAMFKSSLRVTDFAFRIGGEEFVILMPGTEIDSAYQSCVRLCERSKTDIDTLQGQQEVTLSIGVAEVKAEDASDSLFKRVDDLLYEAKHSGKSQVRR